MGATVLQFTHELETLDCGECGITFAVPGEFRADRIKDHRTWYCPNGHPRVFTGESKEEKLARELAEAKRKAETDLTRERHRREAAERSAAAHKGKVTEMRNRIHNGVCPCCKRTFQNVARHMASKHPDFAEKA